MRDNNRAESKENAIKMFEEHFNHLVLYVNQFIKSIPVSEDLVQDLFARLWENGKLTGCTPAFLYICIYHDAMNYLRDRRADVNIEDVDVASSEIDNVEEIQSYFETLENLHHALQSLSPQCRKVLHKIYFENKHYAEVAKEMGISINTVKTHVYLAIKTLKKDFILLLIIGVYSYNSIYLY